MLTVDTVRMVGSAVLLYYVLLTTLAYGLVHSMRIGGWYALLSLTYVVIGASLPGTGGDGGFASIGFMRTVGGMAVTVLYVGAAFAMNLVLSVHGGETFLWMFAISTWPGLLVLVMYAATACFQPREAPDKKYDAMPPRSFSHDDLRVHRITRHFTDDDGPNDAYGVARRSHDGPPHADGDEVMEENLLPTSAQREDHWDHPNAKEV